MHDNIQYSRIVVTDVPEMNSYRFRLLKYSILLATALNCALAQAVDNITFSQNPLISPREITSNKIITNGTNSNASSTNRFTDQANLFLFYADYGGFNLQPVKFEAPNVEIGNIVGAGSSAINFLNTISFPFDTTTIQKIQNFTISGRNVSIIGRIGQINILQLSVADSNQATTIIKPSTPTNPDQTLNKISGLVMKVNNISLADLNNIAFDSTSIDSDNPGPGPLAMEMQLAGGIYSATANQATVSFNTVVNKNIVLYGGIINYGSTKVVAPVGTLSTTGTGTVTLNNGIDITGTNSADNIALAANISAANATFDATATTINNNIFGVTGDMTISKTVDLKSQTATIHNLIMQGTGTLNVKPNATSNANTTNINGLTMADDSLIAVSSAVTLNLQTANSNLGKLDIANGAIVSLQTSNTNLIINDLTLRNIGFTLPADKNPAIGTLNVVQGAASTLNGAKKIGTVVLNGADLAFQGNTEVKDLTVTASSSLLGDYHIANIDLTVDPKASWNINQGVDLTLSNITGLSKVNLNFKTNGGSAGYLKLANDTTFTTTDTIVAGAAGVFSSPAAVIVMNNSTVTIDDGTAIAVSVIRPENNEEGKVAIKDTTIQNPGGGVTEIALPQLGDISWRFNEVSFDGNTKLSSTSAPIISKVIKANGQLTIGDVGANTLNTPSIVIENTGKLIIDTSSAIPSLTGISIYPQTPGSGIAGVYGGGATTSIFAMPGIVTTGQALGELQLQDVNVRVAAANLHANALTVNTSAVELVDDITVTAATFAGSTLNLGTHDITATNDIQFSGINTIKTYVNIDTNGVVTYGRILAAGNITSASGSTMNIEIDTNATHIPGGTRLEILKGVAPAGGGASGQVKARINGVTTVKAQPANNQPYIDGTQLGVVGFDPRPSATVPPSDPGNPSNPGGPGDPSNPPGGGDDDNPPEPQKDFTDPQDVTLDKRSLDDDMRLKAEAIPATLISEQRGAVDDYPRTQVWTNFFNGEASRRGSSALPGYASELTGGLVGIMTIFPSNLSLGITMGEARADYAYTGNKTGDKLSIGSKMLYVHGDYRWHDSGVFLGAVVNYIYSDINSRHARKVAKAEYLDAIGNWKAQTFGGTAKIGYVSDVFKTLRIATPLELKFISTIGVTSHCTAEQNYAEQGAKEWNFAIGEGIHSSSTFNYGAKLALKHKSHSPELEIHLNVYEPFQKTKETLNYRFAGLPRKQLTATRVTPASRSNFGGSLNFNIERGNIRLGVDTHLEDRLLTSHGHFNA